MFVMGDQTKDVNMTECVFDNRAEVRVTALSQSMPAQRLVADTLGG